MIYRFGSFELDDAALTLRRDGELLDAQPLVLAVLVYLVRRRDRVVSKEELIAGPWRGRATSDSSVTQAVSLVRKLLVDPSARGRTIETVRGRGFRFVSAVTCDEIRSLVTGGGRTSPSLVAPLGRTEEIERVAEALEDAAAGRGGLHFLTGEPGIGKTTLARYAAELSRERGFHVLAGAARQLGEEQAFGPWRKVLQGVFDLVWRTHDPKTTSRVDRLRARLAPLELGLAGVAPRGVAELGGTPSREDVFDAALELLALAASAKPLLVLLEDLHDADESSLVLLAALVARLEECAVLVIATARDFELNKTDAVSELLRKLLVSGRRISLSGLGEVDATALLRSKTGAPVPALTARKAVHATNGNPLLLVELVRSAGTLPGGLESALEAATSDVIPDRWLAAVKRSTARFGSRTQRALTSAAVIGMEADLVGIACLLGVAPNEALAHVSPAVRFGWLKEVGLARYAFVHGAIREGLYRDISPDERVRQHAAYLDHLSDRARAGADVHPQELAYHALSAAPKIGPDEPVQHARAAARRSSEQLGHESAVVVLQRALVVCDLFVEERSKLDVLLELGSAQWHAGRSSDAISDFLRAARLARHLGDAVALARAAVGYGEAQTDTLDTELARLLEDSLAGLGEEPSSLGARVRARLAVILTFTPERQRARALADEAVRMARDLGDANALCQALRARRWSASSDETAESLLALSLEAVDVASRTGDRASANAARVWLVADRLGTCDGARAREEIGRFQATAAALGEPLQRATAARFDVTLALLGASPNTAELAERALDMGLQHGDGVARLVFFIQKQVLGRETGDLAAVEAFGRTLLAGVPWDHSWRAALAQMLAEDGRSDEARSMLDVLAEGGFPSSNDMNALTIWALATEACAALDEVGRARVLASIWRQHSGRAVVIAGGVAVLGSTDYFLGRALLTAGDMLGAREAFAKARANLRSFAAPLLDMRTRWSEARAEFGARPRAAVQLAESAVALADRHGSSWLARRAPDECPELWHEVTRPSVPRRKR